MRKVTGRTGKCRMNLAYITGKAGCLEIRISSKSRGEGDRG